MVAILAKMTVLMALALALLFTGFEAVEPEPGPPMLVEAIPADYSNCVRLNPNGPVKKPRRHRYGPPTVGEIA